MSFLAELQELRAAALAAAIDKELIAAKESFKNALAAWVAEKEPGIRNEFKELVRHYPTRVQHEVQRTYRSLKEKPEARLWTMHDPQRKDGMCLFFQGSTEERETVYAKLRDLFPWCSVTFQQKPHHMFKCSPNSDHALHIQFTLRFEE